VLKEKSCSNVRGFLDVTLQRHIKKAEAGEAFRQDVHPDT